MNFSTLTTGQHVITLPMTALVISSLGQMTLSQQFFDIMSWCRENATGSIHVFMHEDDALLDFHILAVADAGMPWNLSQMSNDQAMTDWLGMVIMNAGNMAHVSAKYVFNTPADAMLFKLTWGGQ